MKKTGLLIILCSFFCSFVSGQQGKDGTVTQVRASSTFNQNTTDSKIQLQQQLLLSKQKQLEKTRQEQQKLLVEQQKKELAEKEKQLMELRFQKKQNELEQDRVVQAQLLQKNQLQARYNAAIKDKQINAQKAEIINNRKWNLFWIILFCIVAAFAIVTYYNQRKTKRLNAVISSQHAVLEQMGMVKDTLLSVVSHDMRAPVNTLISFTELINDGDISKEKLGLYLDQINHTLHHTSSLMNNLLNWAASQMQGFKPVIEPVDAGLVASNIVQSYAERALAKKIVLATLLEPGTLAFADANMLDLILRNLVSNALKYTTVGGSITINCDAVNGSMVLSVSDTGMGMSEERMEQFNSAILSPTKSTLGTANEKGTGLGLLLCKTFTRLMNGKLTVQKNEDMQGCRFELSLPKG